MLIYLIRHGQSAGNMGDAFTGITDVPLTEKGVRQAEKTAIHLKSVPFTAVYSSDLIRAYDTAFPHAKMRGLEVITDEAFREIDGGEWENKNYYSLADLYPSEFKVWEQTPALARPVGGESMQEVVTRMYEGIMKLSRRHEGETILLATHSVALRALMVKIKKIEPDTFENYGLFANASITVLSIVDGQIEVVREGDDAHLGEDRTAFV